MFPYQFDLLAAFLVGLFSTVHCIGMCGGIAAALSAGLPPGAPARAWQFHAVYNSGRILSYVAAGSAAGLVGQLVSGQGAFELGRLLLQAVAGLFMLLLGLYLAGWYPLLVHLERAAGGLWRRLEPLGRRWLPLRSVGAALPLGMLWGWLPCGLVYSALAWAAASGGAVEGGGLMLAFGLGTLPSMLATGIAAARFRRLAAGRLRVLSGILVMTLGFATLLSLAQHLG